MELRITFNTDEQFKVRYKSNPVPTDKSIVVTLPNGYTASDIIAIYKDIVVVPNNNTVGQVAKNCWLNFISSKTYVKQVMHNTTVNFTLSIDHRCNVDIYINHI